MITPYILVPILWLLNFSQPAKIAVPEIKVEINIAESLFTKLTSNYTHAPSYTVLEAAIEGWLKLESQLKSPLLTVIDFSAPSTEKRLWIIDPAKGEILLQSVVSHGRNSGELMAESFSNLPESFKSSLGFYTTAETYQGKHGYSLRLDGLEKGFNDLARDRAIVIHGADYANEEFAVATGRLGRSLGCPALPTELSSTVIDIIKDGSLLFIYADDQTYLEQSTLVQP